MRRALAAAAVAALALTGCASSDEPSPTSDETPASSTPAESSGASESPGESHSDDSSHAEAIEIEIEGDRIEPSGERVQVTAGEPVELHIESDRATELHVHSSPEKELQVKQGESSLTLTIDTPGLVDVEDHHTGVVILRLEVR